MTILTVLIVLNGNPTLSMQEFSSRDNCEAMGQILQEKVGRQAINWWCAKK